MRLFNFTLFYLLACSCCCLADSNTSSAKPRNKLRIFGIKNLYMAVKNENSLEEVARKQLEDFLKSREEKAQREREEKQREIERLEHEKRLNIIRKYLASRVGSAVMSDLQSRF